MNFEVISKISSKGQVTIPKKIRDLLKSNVIKFKVIDNIIKIEPVEDVGGSLSKYAKRNIKYQEEREKAWSKAVEKYR